MMYNQKLVCSLKANGKILREFKDTVYIPFGSEYSFLIKNLNTVRALIHIYIDGESVVEGGLVLNAGQEVDLERYVKGGNLNTGNRFKFIERTQAIEDGPRGVKLEDGLVRIEFQFEKPPVSINNLSDWQKRQMLDGLKFDTPIGGTTNSSEYPGVTDRYSFDRSIYATSATYSQVNVGGVLRGVDYSRGEATKMAAAQAINQVAPQSISECHDGMATMDSYVPMNDIGITVPGSKSTQSFTTTYMNAMEPEKHTIVLKLLGETPDNKPVVEAVTVKKKPKCVTCGKQNKATAKFCSECGTALEIFA